MNKLNKIFLALILILIVIIGILTYNLLKQSNVINESLEREFLLQKENDKLFNELSEYRYLYESSNT